jgi:hypothetical protein
MIHFIFTPMDRRYLFLKADTDLEHSIIRNKLMEVLNLTDPICHLATYSGPPFKQEFIWQYRQSSGDIIYYAPLGMWYPIWKWFKDNNITDFPTILFMKDRTTLGIHTGTMPKYKILEYIRSYYKLSN